AGVARCLDSFGRLDILVNNAGTNPQFGLLVDAELAAVEKTWKVNQLAPLHHVQAAWRSWMRQHGGTVLNVASIGGLRAGPMIGAYNVSKAALIHLTRQLAIEMAPGVRVNAVAPAVVKTRFSVALYAKDEEKAAAAYPLRRLGTTDDVAAAVLFLVSDAASWITGEVLVLDGGASVGLPLDQEAPPPSTGPNPPAAR
ncbi:MAG: glucose 1-dehydrogenase, partial [Acidimicrobiia bacterium]